MIFLVFLRWLTRRLCSSLSELLGLYPFSVFFCCRWAIFLQLYAADEPAVRIGLFRQHSPPEQLDLGDNYATFYFNFLYEPLLLNALLALSLNRWIDGQDGTVEY